MLALKQNIVEWVNLWNHTTSPLTYQCSFLFSRTVNCASIAAQLKWFRGRKDYESNVLVLVFLWSYRWLNKGGYSTENQVVWCAQKIIMLLLYKSPRIWMCKLNFQWANRNTTLFSSSSTFLLFLFCFLWIFFSNFLTLFYTNRGADNKWNTTQYM